MPKQVVSRNTKRGVKPLGRSGRVAEQPVSDLLVFHIQPVAERRGRKNADFPQLNVRETARNMGMNESYLGRLLNRKYKYGPSLRTAKKLSEAFNVTLEEIERIYHDDSRTERIPVPNAPG